MNLLLIGATSRTGRHVLDEGRARGHRMTAFCRTPSKLPGEHADLDVFVGDATRTDDLVPALADQEAAILIVSAPDRGAHTVFSDATLALLRAMEQVGPRRVVLASSRSVVASRPTLVMTFLWLWLRNPYRDLARAEGMLQASGVDWRIGRAVRLRDGRGTGRAHMDQDVEPTEGDWNIDRIDYGRALLELATDPKRAGAWGISGALAGHG